MAVAPRLQWNWQTALGAEFFLRAVRGGLGAWSTAFYRGGAEVAENCGGSI